MKHLLLAAIFVPCVALAAPDLATPQGFVAACAALPGEAKALKSNAERQAFAACRDVALIQQVIRWAKNGMAEMDRNPAPDHIRTELRKQLIHMRDSLREVRVVLSGLKLKPGEGLMLAPGQWQLDLDGDGKIDPWERYFFATPKRSDQPVDIAMPSNEPDHYRRHYQPEARFRVDASDVLWALAYHQFAEGLLEILLAHQYNHGVNFERAIELRDKEALLRAHRLIASGIQSSAALRRSLLAETDDQDEWIPNARQKNSVFPLAMDSQAFETWGRFLAEFPLLWEGKTLLAAARNAGGILGDIAKRCPPGTGLNIALLFRQPGRFPFAEGAQHTSCMAVDAKHPASGLMTMMEEAMERGRANPNSPEWQFVRYLYWVN